MKTSSNEIVMRTPADQPVVADSRTDSLKQRLVASLKRRKHKGLRLNDADFQKLCSACEEIYKDPHGPGAAKQLKWIFDSQAYLAVEGHFDLLCSEILGLNEAQAKKLLASAKSDERNEPAAPVLRLAAEVSAGKGQSDSPDSTTPMTAEGAPASAIATEPKDRTALNGTSRTPSGDTDPEEGASSSDSQKTTLPADFDPAAPVIGTWDYARKELNKPRPPSVSTKKTTKAARKARSTQKARKHSVVRLDKQKNKSKPTAYTDGMNLQAETEGTSAKTLVGLAAVVALNPQEKEKFARLEVVIADNWFSTLDLGRALIEIRDENLYRATHKTFETYCRDRWGIGRAHGYRTRHCSR